jgi:dephospho-CoA kinase
MNRPVIGLIGGIGSGKSQVADALRQHGGHVVSGDALGHEALRQPAIKERVVERWGASILGEDGEVNRRAVGQIVFADADERKELEALVFPYIRRRFQEEIARAENAFVVLDAAVLLEAGWNDLCTHIVFVDVPRHLRLDRLRRQRGWSEQEVTARENAQWPLEQKRARADFVFDNSVPLENLPAEVESLTCKLGLVS